MTQRDRPDNLDSINHLLQAAADCTSALLSNENFERGIDRALEILGTNISADRLAIGEQHDDPTEETLGYVVFNYEWLSPSTISQVRHPELKRIDCEDFGEDHYQLISGNHVGGLIETYPELFRSGQEQLEVKATYAVPITVQGQYWGLLGLDFCQTAKELCEAQIAPY